MFEESYHFTFVFICMCVFLCEGYPQTPEEGIRSSGTAISSDYEVPSWVPGIKLQSSAGSGFLTTEPSLYPLEAFFKDNGIHESHLSQTYPNIVYNLAEFHLALRMYVL